MRRDPSSLSSEASPDAGGIVSSNPNWITHPNVSSAFVAIFELGLPVHPGAATRSVYMN
jgi:hypothetical protein